MSKSHISGDAFYISNDIFAEFFSVIDSYTLLELLTNRRTEAFRAAEESGNEVVGVDVTNSTTLSRTEFRYIYGEIDE